MQKDVIYIDVEDDITAIIGKVKDGKEKVVALVPPKRVGVLQSAVNLRLLQRAAMQKGKHLVLITNNQALLGLAATAKIPVAKTLQSKPEIPEIAVLSIDDGDDVIDGSELPVGEPVAMSQVNESDAEGLVADIDIEDDTPKQPTANTKAKDTTPPRKKSNVKVPSFNAFRKKLVIGGGIGMLAMVFLVWAIWFAPRATVVIDAQTADKEVKIATTLGPDVSTDAETAMLKSIVQTEKKQASIDFTATGTKDVGDKATGVVVFSTNSISNLGTTIPAGTQLTSSGGSSFTTTQGVTLTLSNYSGASVGIAAADIGEQYNGASGAMSGAPTGISADISGSTAGGTKRTVKIVLQADVQKAKEQLAEQSNDDIKKELTAKFSKDTIMINESFTATVADPTVVPAIGEETADGKAKLSSETTYSLTAVNRGELDGFLKATLQEALDTSRQRVYDTGIKTVRFTNFKAVERSATAQVAATGQIGPKIDDQKIKEQVRGKRFGEIQSELKTISGVNDADTKFWPFWVNTVPNDVNRITIEFKLQSTDD
ncbi:MAG: hypothetical protein WAS27_00205 [Candidatus Saccharimonadales bacterium]